MFKLGMTGSSEIITEEQVEAFLEWFQEKTFREFHHGDCVVADETICNLVKSTLFIVCHPPINSSKRAFCEADVMLPEKPYLERNRNIVDAVEILIAFPDGPERIRSGTWSTIRYARKTNVPDILFWPDGTIE